VRLFREILGVVLFVPLALASVLVGAVTHVFDLLTRTRK
jgi:hypothetical protein